MKIHVLALMVAGVFLISGCMVNGHHDRHRPPDRNYQEPGPPPHAPAHGYRHKHRDGRDLEYDSYLGVYVVLRVPDTYFYDDVYIRMSSDGRWIVSQSIDRGWRMAAENEVPYRFRKYKESHRNDKYEKRKDQKKFKHGDWDDDD